MIRLRPTRRGDIQHCLPLLAQLGCAPTPEEMQQRFAAVIAAPGMTAG